MAEQPSYRPYRPSTFFDDGRSARPLVPGTVPQPREPEEPRLLTGRVPTSLLAAEAASAVGVGQRDDRAIGALLALRPQAEYVTALPFKITKEDLERGQDRYTIFCAVCHDPVGNGRGKIVERGFTMPPSYHSSFARGLARRGANVRLRDAPVGYFFEVITNGYGAMPDYATQIPPTDRWRIIAYIRALQWSQHASLAELPPDERAAALQAAGQN
jgi:mono/diheme cytochrome c family protein